jgi:hypothetical protein
MKNLRKIDFFQKYVSLLALGTQLVMGCGTAPFQESKKKGSRDASYKDQLGSTSESASMQLTLPPVGPLGDSLDVALSLKSGSTTNQVYSKTVPSSQGTVNIDSLTPGSYLISLRVWDSRTKNVLSKGTGEATLEKGRTATAKVRMNQVASDTGTLIIEVDNTPAPTVCSTEYMLPTCVKSGNGYKVQFYEKNAQCEWMPKIPASEIVASNFCKGLPGSEVLVPPPSESPSPPPTVCPAIARLPDCVRSGAGYRVQIYSQNALCEFVPQIPASDIVNPSFCKGLPNAELIRL